MPSKSLIHSPPDSASEIAKLADRALRKAGAIGVLPTPIDDLIKAAEITDESEAGGVAQFLSTLDEQSRNVFGSVLQKMRGLSDMRARAIYVPSDKPPRQSFAKAHELGHQIVPWHNPAGRAGKVYQDNDATLCPEVQDLYEREANFCASEVIYQGQNFVPHARGYRPSFDAVATLADLHGASRQATLRRYVEAQDEMLAAVSYLPSRVCAADGRLPVLCRPRMFGSPKFVLKFGGVKVPEELGSDHPWALARNISEVCEDYIQLECGGECVSFWWQSWWNSYSLLVLLRREPRLSVVGHLIRRL